LRSFQRSPSSGPWVSSSRSVARNVRSRARPLSSRSESSGDGRSREPTSSITRLLPRRLLSVSVMTSVSYGSGELGSCSSLGSARASPIPRADHECDRCAGTQVSFRAAWSTHCTFYCAGDGRGGRAAIRVSPSRGRPARSVTRPADSPFAPGSQRVTSWSPPYRSGLVTAQTRAVQGAVRPRLM